MLKKLCIMLIVSAMLCSSISVFSNNTYASAEANQTGIQEEVIDDHFIDEAPVACQEYEG